MKNKFLLPLIFLSAFGMTSLGSCDEAPSDTFDYEIAGSGEVILTKANIVNDYDEFTIPNETTIENKKYTVVGIGKKAFESCYKVKTLNMSNDIRFIEDAAFQFSNINTINFSTNLVSIGKDAFFGSKLKGNLKLPESLIIIGDNAFGYSDYITSVTIPKNVISIGASSYGIEGAFKWCESLQTIVVSEDNQIYDSREDCNAIIETKTNTMIDGCNKTLIPDSIETIGSDVFLGCKYIKEINIPSSVKLFHSILWSCDNLENIRVANDNDFYYSESNCIIEKESNTIIGACNNSSIPSSATKIKSYGFAYCNYLKRIIIPNYIEFVGTGAFCNWKSDQTIIVEPGNKHIDEWAYDWKEDCEAIIINNN